MEKNEVAYWSDVRFKLKGLSLLDNCEDRDLVNEFEGRIIYAKVDDQGNPDKEKIIGRIQGARVDLGEAMERRVHPYNVFDDHSRELSDYYGAFFDDEGELREDLELDSIGDVLIIHSVTVASKYRGQSLGLLALRRAIKTFGGGCALAALKPFPLQFQNKVTEKNQAKFDSAKQKLRDYWGRLGFVRCRDTEYYYLDLCLKWVPMEKLIASGSSPG